MNSSVNSFWSHKGFQSLGLLTKGLYLLVLDCSLLVCVWCLSHKLSHSVVLALLALAAEQRLWSFLPTEALRVLCC